MSRERYDTGIDWLRLAAAILVIAIHTHRWRISVRPGTLS